MERAVALVGSAAMLVGGVGCFGYRDLVDPCYPDRYTNQSNREVNGFFAPQVLNGQVLDQTVWTWFFDTGTDKLNGAGLEQLGYIARRRPAPDPHVYVQAASVQEVGGYDPAKPEAMVHARNELDAKRVASVQKFLMAQTVGRGIDFHVDVHDPADPGMPSAGIANGIREMQGRFKGGLSSGGGASVSGGGGSSGSSGSSGGASGSSTPR
jgi:uncharacterized membrane protein YgcG